MPECCRLEGAALRHACRLMACWPALPHPLFLCSLPAPPPMGVVPLTSENSYAMAACPDGWIIYAIENPFW